VLRPFAGNLARCAAANEALADLVTDKIRAIPGILSSQTLIAFRAYSPRSDCSHK
jgi:hypothetical protein